MPLTFNPSILTIFLISLKFKSWDISDFPKFSKTSLNLCLDIDFNVFFSFVYLNIHNLLLKAHHC